MIVVGIDVAKESLAVSCYDGAKHQVSELAYTKQSIRKVLIVPYEDKKHEIIFVMEGTGNYHVKIAYQLIEDGYHVSVVNPLIIKRYAQMHLKRVKTDSVDAKLIAEYGYEFAHKLNYFKIKSKAQIEVTSLIQAINDLNKQKTMCTNQYLALKRQVNYSKEALDSYKRHKRFIDLEIEKLEKKLLFLLQTDYQESYKLLQSIPGIGLKVSAMIIATFNTFENFQSSKQASSFIGIATSPYESGTSVKGRGSISKRGSPFARQILYMGGLVAAIHNPLIKQQYQRLLLNGKPKMVAIVAAANKLLRIAFGVLKSGKPFDVNYVKVYNI
jgi:transposase